MIQTFLVSIYNLFKFISVKKENYFNAIVRHKYCTLEEFEKCFYKLFISFDISIKEKFTLKDSRG